eukprot:352130-Chlamydomonas_euryale.AAC.1
MSLPTTTSQPDSLPACQPDNLPVSQPACQPASRPASQPAMQPSDHITKHPSNKTPDRPTKPTDDHTPQVSFALYCAAKEAASAAAAGAAATEDACQPGSRKRRAPSHTALAPAAGPAPKLFVEAPSTVNAAKALKNAREMAGMREAHLRDAV